MRELTFVARKKVEWRESPAPTLTSDHGALVAPVTATTCDLDSALLAGHGLAEPPFAFGHECVARVLDVGDAVATVAPGDLVVVPWHICCGTCDRCLAGQQAHCRSVPPMAMYGIPVGGDWGGTFSDVVHVPWADAMAVRLPAGLDPVAMASASDNWTLAWRLTVPYLSGRPGTSVLIVSRGSIGLYACDLARAAGAADVLYVDPDPDRRAIAAGYGARTAERMEPVRHGFGLALELTGRVDDLVTALRSLRPEGHCESAAPHFRQGELPLLELYLNGTTLRMARDNVRAHLDEALDAALSPDVDPGRVVSDVLDWDDIPDAILEPRVKPVFVRDPDRTDTTSAGRGTA
ncbi:alcohol dehydrogenase catalytic domain-containing protein [Actinocorallia sp. API 0066]|uniref:zinc-dependent alcohol dehydrogenase n=1 Tax=Actinocorallia sp. API 0066 TaxID=2896846 RepID=UPI001E2EFA91|nr:alcohol dehydrogenase catalytic domain-containing protein [Actinocorallia sp. API 0066]MCD0448233.1 alcohol dehydrogenase catalytic domain-containing protein [Actinocorallia sp. API 0066]